MFGLSYSPRHVVAARQNVPATPCSSHFDCLNLHGETWKSSEYTWCQSDGIFDKFYLLMSKLDHTRLTINPIMLLLNDIRYPMI